MNSAAKLRSRRGIAVLGTTALIATSFGPAAFAAWDAAPQNGGATPTFSEPAIGIVDTDKATAGSQGATLVQAGQDNQALGDVRLVLPNSFRKGDVIDLRILDRSATEQTNGVSNSGPSTKIELAAAPQVNVAGPHADATQVDPTNQANENTPNNTEGTLNAWTADGRTGVTGTAPGVTPAFDVARVASTGSAYQDTIRLTVNTDPSTGDPNAQWVVTLSDLKVNLGASVTPGELRLVPFAYNGDENNLVAAPSVFSGNVEAQANLTNNTRQAQREINIYTVPAYVSPVTVSMANLQLAADGRPQKVNDLTITETQGFSLGNGTYTVNFEGATVANVDTKSITAKVTNGGTNEAVTIDGITTDANGNKTGVTFTVSGADESRKSTITMSGLLLQSQTDGQVKVDVRGGRIDQWLSTAGQSPQITATNGDILAQASPWFVAQGGGAGVNQVTTAGTGNAQLSPAEAAKFPAGTQTVNYTADTYNYTVTVPATGDTTNLDVASVDQTEAGKLGQGTATLANQAAVMTNTLAPTNNTAGVSGLTAAELAQFGGTDGTTATYRVAGDTTNNRLNILNASGTAVFSTVNGSGATVTPGQDITFIQTADPSQSITLTANSLGAFDIASAETTAAGMTLTANGKTWVYEGSTPSANASVTFTNPNVPADTIALAPTTGNALGVGTFNLARTGNAASYSMVVDGVTYTSANGQVFAKPSTDTSAAPSTIAFTAPLVIADPTVNGVLTFEITSVVGEDPATNIGVNQDDILAPLDRLTQIGVATADSTRIGGNNRYETAAKVAQQQFASGSENVILASGENFPDALSASYLSQRMNAPILLTMNGRLPSDTVEALRNLGTQKVYIIGGDQAISKEVEAALRDLSTYTINANTGANTVTGSKMQAQRIAGGSRYTTNQLVNMYGAAWGNGEGTIGKTVYKYGEAGKYTAIFARGDNFPDALAAGVLTAGVQNDGFSRDNALPLILTAPNELSGSAIAQIDNLDVQHGLIIGSDNAISNTVKTAIEDRGVSNTRLGGDDRYFTAAAVAEFAMRPAVGNATTNEYPGLGFLQAPQNSGTTPAAAGTVTDPYDVTSYLSTGIKFADALTAGPWIGRKADVMNLTQGANELSAGTADFLTKRAADVDRAVAIGLGQAVSTQVLNEANRLASAK